MKKLIFTALAVLLLMGSVNAISAYDIRWWHQKTWGPEPSGDLRRWSEEMEGRVGGQLGTGRIFYVDSNVTNEGDGSSWTNARDTLDEAVGLCEDNRGDVIYVAQGHTEEFVAINSADLDVIGITVIGFGTGSNRPTFTYTTGTAGELVIAAANVTIQGLVFQPGIADVVHAIEIEPDADGSVIQFCEFLSGTTDAFEFVDAIQVPTLATDDLIIRFNKATETTAGAVSWLDITAGIVDNLSVYSNEIYGDYSEAVVSASTIVHTAGYFGYNVITNLNAADLCFDFQGAATGVLEYNRMFAPAFATTLDPGSLSCVENYAINTTDLSAIRVPVLPALSVITHTAGSSEDILEKLYYASDGTGAFPATVANDSTLAKIMAKGSTATASTFDNTTDSLEAIADAVGAVSGLGFRATCEVNAGGAGNFTAVGLAGFGDDYFNTGWSVICILNADAPGTAQEGEIRDIEDYDSGTGLFDVDGDFGAIVTTGDGVYVRRNEELNFHDVTMLGGSVNIWYLDDGGSGGDGTTWQTAFTSLENAEAAMAAGDVLYVGKNHAESVKTGGDLLNLAGISIIGQGEGDSRPLFTCDAAADEITLDAAGITLKNLRFRPGATVVTACIRVEDAALGATIEDCSFEDGQGADEEFIDCISVDTSAAGLTVKNCTASNANATAGDPDTWLNLDEATIADATVIGCTVFGDFDEACIWSDAVPTNISIRGNTLSNTTTGQFAIEFQDAATGVISGNRLFTDSYTTMLDPGSAICTDNMGTDAINQQAIRIPISAETTDVLEVANGSDLERIEYLQNKSDDILARLRATGGTIGDVFYLDAGGASGNNGTSWELAEDTLTNGYNDCSAGDILFISPGYAETIVTGSPLTLATAGVRVIGIGDGDQRPTFSFSGTNSSINVNAADNLFENLIFFSTAADTTIGLDIKDAGDGTIIRNCEFKDTGGFEFLTAVDLSDDADRVTIENNRFIGGIGCTEAIQSAAGTVTRLSILGNYFYGTYSAAVIQSDQVDTFNLIMDNVVTNLATGVHAIEYSAAATGELINNKLSSDTYGSILDPGAMRCFDNKQTVGVDGTAIDVPLRAGETYSVVILTVDLQDDNLFEVAGGPILITSFSGLITETVAGAAETTKIIFDGVDDFDFSTAVDLTGKVRGTRIVFSAVNAAVLTPIELGAVGSGNLMNPWFCPVGMIEQDDDENNDQNGIVSWYMTFIPLVDGVSVVPQ